MSDYASESGHWYDPKSGGPRYTIVGKNGKERAVTLRDARPWGWVPGLTTINRCANAPQLTRYFQRKAVLSALRVPRQEGEAEADWVERVIDDSQQEGKDAADGGTILHAAVERFYLGKTVETKMMPWALEVARVVSANCGTQTWLPEKSYASAIFGYGTKIDLQSAEWLIDFKSTEKPLSTLALYDDHYQQLAAGRRLVGQPLRCAIVYIDRNEPKARFIEADELDLARGLVMFDALLGYWCAKNRYYPGRWLPAAA